MNFRNPWHQPEIAALWPAGSVVLIRAHYGPQKKNTYILSQFFNPKMATPGREFMLVEDAETRKENS